MYSFTIFKTAAKVSFMHISWLICLIGIPVVYFRDGLNLLEKTFLLVGLLMFFWLLYLALCFLFHRYSLRNPEARSAFVKLDDIAKGKEIGSYLEGW